MELGALLGSTVKEHVEASSQLLLLSIFPGQFSSWAAAHVLGDPKSFHTWYIDNELYPLLQRLLPGGLLREGRHGHLWYRMQPELRGQLGACLAQRPSLRDTGMLRYVDCVTSRVLQQLHALPGHRHKEQQEAMCRDVAHILELIATRQLDAALLNTWKDGELGLSLCRCMDIMCPPLKVNPYTEPALKLLLEHPHDPTCPFCIFHLYPTLHAQGKLREMDEWLALILLRAPRLEVAACSEAPYPSINIHLDYLTSKSYSLLLQGRGAEAEALTRHALELSREPWQRLNNSNNLVFALRQQGKLQEALEASVGVLEMLPDDEVDRRFRSESHLAVGLVYRDLGRLEEAEARLLQAVAEARLLDDDKDVDDMRLYTCYHASKVLLQQQDKVKAARAVELALEAQQHASRWCLPGHPLPPRLHVLVVDAVIALFTLPSYPRPASPAAAPTPASAAH